jgi:hypothetical protein
MFQCSDGVELFISSSSVLPYTIISFSRLLSISLVLCIRKFFALKKKRFFFFMFSFISDSTRAVLIILFFFAFSLRATLRERLCVCNYNVFVRKKKLTTQPKKTLQSVKRKRILNQHRCLCRHVCYLSIGVFFCACIRLKKM